VKWNCAIDSEIRTHILFSTLLAIMFLIWLLALYFCSSGLALEGKVLVIGGYSDGDSLSSVELIDLVNPQSNCPTVSDFPIAIRAGIAASLDNGEVWYCGGTDKDSVAQDSCYSYDVLRNNWDQQVDLNEKRSYSASSVVGQYWYITGGDPTPISTEFYNETGKKFVNDKNLPTTLTAHCQVTVDDERVFLASDGYEAYMLNVQTGRFSDLPRMDSMRLNAACGLIRSADYGDEIVVASQGTSSVLNLDSMLWMPGPPLDNFTYYGSTVQLDDTFLLIGGDSGQVGAESDAIWLFDNDSFQFVQLEQRLSKGRSKAASVLLPEEINAIITC